MWVGRRSGYKAGQRLGWGDGGRWCVAVSVVKHFGVCVRPVWAGWFCRAGGRAQVCVYGCVYKIPPTGTTLEALVDAQQRPRADNPRSQWRGGVRSTGCSNRP